MNSTNENADAIQIKRCYFDEVLPAAKRMLADGKLFFPVATDEKLETYYVTRRLQAASAADYEIAGCDSPEHFELALSRMWSAEGNPELIHLAKSMARLAESLHSAKEQSDEVSPFIYVMF